MTKELNCMNCCIGNFKYNLCDCEGEFYKEFKCVGSGIDFTKMVMDRIRPKGKWVGVQEYCKHLEEKTGERYAPTGLGKLIYCNQCWQANDRRSAYCPDCGADMRSKIVGKHADFMMMDEAVVKGADDE